jgi:hypothetical protein
MTLDFDVSMHTAIITGAIGGATLILRATAWALVEAFKTFMAHMMEATAKVEMLDLKLTNSISSLGDVDNFRARLNNHDDQLKKGQVRIHRIERHLNLKQS